MSKDRYLRVTKIRNGTVIDHLNPLHMLDIIKILGLQKYHSVVTAAINVPSSKMEKKGIIKIEDKLLTEDETNIISLFSPNATINIIKDYRVTDKNKVKLPDKIEGLLSCINTNCITKENREYIITKFYIISKEPVTLKCHYCETIMSLFDVINQYTGK